MQRSEKQIIASRLNGAKSRGPITPEGKLRSCQNAIRHDAVTRSITLDAENSPYFQHNLGDLCNTWRPANLTEHRLIESMAVALWKKDRYELAEKCASDERVQIERDNLQPTAWPDAPVISKAVCHLAGNERAIRTLNQAIALLDRQYHRNLNMLMKVQLFRRRYGLGQNPGDDPGNDPTQLDQSPMSPVMNPPAAADPEPEPAEPVMADLEPAADATIEPAATDAAPALTTLAAPQPRKGTHNVFPINTPPHAQHEEPEPHGVTDAPESGTHRRTAGGAAA